MAASKAALPILLPVLKFDAKTICGAEELLVSVAAIPTFTISAVLQMCGRLPVADHEGSQIEKPPEVALVQGVAITSDESVIGRSGEDPNVVWTQVCRACARAEERMGTNCLQNTMRAALCALFLDGFTTNAQQTLVTAIRHSIFATLALLELPQNVPQYEVRFDIRTEDRKTPLGVAIETGCPEELVDHLLQRTHPDAMNDMECLNPIFEAVDRIRRSGPFTVQRSCALLHLVLRYAQADGSGIIIHGRYWMAHKPLHAHWCFLSERKMVLCPPAPKTRSDVAYTAQTLMALAVDAHMNSDLVLNAASALNNAADRQRTYPTDLYTCLIKMNDPDNYLLPPLVKLIVAYVVHPLLLG